MDMTMSSCVRKDLVEGSRRKVTTASLAAKAEYEGIEKDGKPNHAVFISFAISTSGCVVRETVRRLLPAIGAEGSGNVVAAAMLTQTDQGRRMIESARREEPVIDDTTEEQATMEEQGEMNEVDTSDQIQERNENVMDQINGSEYHPVENLEDSSRSTGEPIEGGTQNMEDHEDRNGKAR